MADVPLGDLLRCAIQVMGRLAVPAERVSEVVGPGAKQLKAYNLCDGSKSQSQVAKAAGLDRGNFNRTATRWIESGVLFKIGDGNEAKLLHVYPVVKPAHARPGRKGGAAKRRRNGAGRRKRATGRSGR